MFFMTAVICAGYRQWKEAKRSLYSFDGDGRGMHYKLGKLSFLVVKNSGSSFHRFSLFCSLDVLCVLFFMNRTLTPHGSACSGTGYDSKVPERRIF